METEQLCCQERGLGYQLNKSTVWYLVREYVHRNIQDMVTTHKWQFIINIIESGRTWETNESM